jgi:cyclic beta-1,2-glucan synthetase
MGSCDWNDGLSEVRGESVWLTQFYLLTLRLFSPYFSKEDAARFKAVQEELSCALALYCTEDDRYLRAFFEDGSPLGSQNSSYCQIDLLPQAFAVFLNPGDPFAKKAIDSAYRLLWQKKEGLFRLFAPSYDHEAPFPGYLGGYFPGFRENGGQYTHAAVWGAMALLLAGDHSKGFEVLKDINPITLWQKEHSVYALEPYCLAGDVYFARGLEGRGGWSHYTGSAGWYLTALLHVLLGYREQEGFFTLHPRLCDGFDSFLLTVSKKETVYRIEACLSDKNGILLDGKDCENKFFFDKGRHNVKILLQKSKK